MYPQDDLRMINRMASASDARHTPAPLRIANAAQQVRGDCAVAQKSLSGRRRVPKGTTPGVMRRSRHMKMLASESYQH